MTMPQARSDASEDFSASDARFGWLRETVGRKPAESAVWGLTIGAVLGIPAIYMWTIFGTGVLGLFITSPPPPSTFLLLSSLSQGGGTCEILMEHMPYALMVWVMVAATAVVVSMSLARLRHVRWTTVLFFEFVGHGIPSLLLWTSHTFAL